VIAWEGGGLERTNRTPLPLVTGVLENKQKISTVA